MPKKAVRKCDNVKPELIQVFTSYKMPGMFNGVEREILLVGGREEGCPNDSYIRWYPRRVEEEVRPFSFFDSEEMREAGKVMNKWLMDHGMEWDKEDKYFHVLIHVSW